LSSTVFALPVGLLFIHLSFFEVMTLELGKHTGAKLAINPILSNKKVPTSGRC